VNFYRVRNTGSKIMNWKEHQNKQYCIFLNVNTKRCDIYEDRPKVCREYICDKINFDL
jgi:Fe-S-cluster containining protein